MYVSYNIVTGVPGAQSGVITLSELRKVQLIYILSRPMWHVFSQRKISLGLQYFLIDIY